MDFQAIVSCTRKLLIPNKFVRQEEGMASGNTLYENHLDHLVEEANDIKAGGEDLMERGMDLKAGEVEWKFIGWQCCLKTTKGGGHVRKA